MMSENNLKIKVSAKEQNLTQNGNSAFDQHKFISDIYDCEKELYILRQHNNELKEKEEGPKCPEFKNTLYYNNYCKELKKKKPFPKAPEKPDTLFNNLVSVPMFAIGGVIGGAVLDITVDVIKKDIFFAPGFYLLIFAIVLGFVVGVITYLKTKTEYSDYLNKVETIKKVNANIVKHNNERYEFWKKECNNNYFSEKYDFEKRVEPLIRRERYEVCTQIEKIEDTLVMLYNLRINGVLCLHPNYQGLVPISIIYGYFDTGRCTQLQGHEGAYNLYEDEKMKGMIINKLDIVSQQLGQLNNSMLYVGQAIEECNNRLSDLESTSNRMIQSVNSMNNHVTSQLNGVSSQMAAIEENTANSAYYAEIGARMTTFNTVYNLLND